MASQGLTPRQQAFVREYVFDHNATQAAIRAKYKPENAGTVGPRLVRKSRIKRAIREAEECLIARSNLTIDKFFRELCLIAFSEIEDYEQDDAGRIKLRQWAQPGATRAISSKERTKTLRTSKDGAETEEVKTKIRLWDKMAALKLIAQHFGLVTPQEKPALDAFFDSLPADTARNLREYLAGEILKGGSAGSPSGSPGNG